MEQKFTPAPWGDVSENESKEWFTIRSPKGPISRAFYGDMKPIVSREEAEANAKLIAAAPEMYDALIELIPFAKNWINENHPVMEKAIEVIKKATE